MTRQRELFAADGQESLFGPAERDLLDHLAEQATADDVKAARELARWARS